MEAFDFSGESLRKARALNREARVRVKYWRDDFNTVKLRKNRYSIIFFHGSLHHVTKLEHLLDQVSDALAPGGLLYIDEYVGPSQKQWVEEPGFADRELAPARELFERLPDSLKKWPVNPPIDINDPSEAVRSNEILPFVRERFEVLHELPYWGNLLHPIYCCINGAETMKEEHRPLVEQPAKTS